MSPIKKKGLEPISRAQICTYAEASGDPNRIHLDDEYAKKFGLPSVVAHGMLTMGLVARVVDDWGYPPDSWIEYEAKFKDKVFPEDVLTVELLDDKNQTLHIEVKNQKENLILSASVHYR